MNMYEIALWHAKSDRALRALVAEQLSGMQVTLMEWLLLGVVANGKSSGMTMSQIAGALHVTLPQVTALVNKLQPLKLIKQKAASSDRRSRIVTLTSKGQLILEDANKALDIAQDQWFDGISAEDRKTFVAVLQKLAV